MRLNASHLTFGKIANEWARELAEAKVPGRRARDEIFLEMVRGVWRGQFADTVLTIEQAPRDDKDGQRYKPAPMPVTPETLDKMVLLRSGVCPRDPDASRWKFRASLKLEVYEPLSLRAWFEPLTISKDAFGDWCDQCGHARPAFWFGKQPAPAHHDTKILGPQNVPFQSQAKAAQLRSELQRWLEQTAVKTEAQAFVKKDFLERAREEINRPITDNLFRYVWNMATIPEKFRERGRRPSRN